MAIRTCICFISLLAIAGNRGLSQDTVTVPLSIRAGFDLSGPVMKLVTHDMVSFGGLASADLNENFAVTAGLKFTSFGTSVYSYDFSSQGISFVAGADYNFMKPKTAQGRHYAGIGLRYGLSLYSQEASGIKYTNIWGTGESSVPRSRHAGHFLEITPGVRTELFKGVTIGWNLYMRLLISAGAGRDLKPVWMPGFGAATSRMTTGAEYYISVSIPYKTIKVFVPPKKADEEEETEEGGEFILPGPASGSGGRR